MQTKATIDLSGFNQLLTKLDGVFVAYGDETIFPKTIKHQAGLLAMEVSKQLGPKTKERGDKKIEFEQQQTYAEVTPTKFEGSRKGIKGPLQWMFGVKKLDYLVGIEPKNDLAGFNTQDLMRGKKADRGVKWMEVGLLGKQRLMRLNRGIVDRGMIKKIVALKSKRVGRMRATFAYAAKMCGISKVQGWVSRHFDDVSSDGAAIFDQSNLNRKPNPEIAFGGRAPGLHQFAPMIEKAVKVRSAKLADRIALIVREISKRGRTGKNVRVEE